MKPLPKALAVNAEGLAGLYGVTLATTLAWIKEGLPATKKGGAFVVDVSTAIRWVRARDKDAARAELDRARKDSPIGASKARKLAAEARIAEVNAALAEREAVHVGDVTRQWEELILAAREKLLSLPTKALQLGLVKAGDPEARLIDLVDESLSELAARGTDVARVA